MAIERSEVEICLREIGDWSGTFCASRGLLGVGDMASFFITEKSTAFIWPMLATVTQIGNKMHGRASSHKSNMSNQKRDFTL